jgi:hypothetical protein
MDEVDKVMAELEKPTTGRSKTFSQLLAEGVPHAGGLRQLAREEQAGSLFGSSEARDAPSESPTSTKAPSA